jgi:pyruvate dehydrogenase E2 component (dihydrolipoamide acetyltransferase)
MTDILLPAVSPTMEKGTLARWLIALGQEVSPGDVIAELETDKASVEIQAEARGVLAEILVQAGTSDVAVGTVIGRLAPSGSKVASHSSSPRAPQAAHEAHAHATTRPAQTANDAPNAFTDETTHLRASLRPAANQAGKQPESPATRGSDSQSDKVLASPMARRLARQLDIDLSQVRGSGAHGRITKQDLERVDPRLLPAPGVATKTTPYADILYPAPSGVPHETTPLSAMRKTIARRLGESKRTVPHFYMSVDVLMDALLVLREQCNARPGADKLSVNDFVVRAAAMALVKVPAANVQYGGEVVHRFQRVDISMAVAVSEGLYTPVIRDAANKSVAVIARESQALVAKARAGKLHPNDYEGGTFSVSNLGMFGIKQFEAVINPPQAAILAIGVVEKRVVPDADDKVVVRRALTATLSCDHRVIDGAVGAELLAEIKRRLEDPLGLLLG